MAAVRPLLAQSTPGPGTTMPSTVPGHSRMMVIAPRSVRHRSPPPSVDQGPYTPDANAAYQGGGMILQGAPGAPAPTPEATPPGQTPRDMVPLP